jgi:hypothetical protein
VPPSNEDAGRDEQFWAKHVSELHVGRELPAEAVNLNLEGRRVAGLAGGFGKMWRKSYRVWIRGTNATPQSVVKRWKADFPLFWPKKARFFGPMSGVTPGDVALINMKIGGGVKLSTGIVVLYADEESFSFMMPEGGMFNGMITFSAKMDGPDVQAQVQAQIRAQDPLYELGMIVGVAHRQEDKHWSHTLQSLARAFGTHSDVEMERELVDKKRQWDQFGNIRKSAALRSALHTFTRPVRALTRRPHG